MKNNINYPEICKKCYWHDNDNAQCFDGHIQSSKRHECESFKLKNIKEQRKMEISIDKEQEANKTLIELLSKESVQVLQTAYVYAKNYVKYGEDVTKTWATATQQAYVMQEVRQKAWTEAYDSFKKDYETRLKAEKSVMLSNIRNEIIRMKSKQNIGVWECLDIIDKYKVKDEETK